MYPDHKQISVGNLFFFAALFFMTLLITGCYSGAIRVVDQESHKETDVVQNDVEIALAQAQELQNRQQVRNTGSLWYGDQSRSYFFQDAKAGFIGDIVTVKIVENAKGSKDAKTQTGRSSNLSTSTTSFFGTPANTLAGLGAGTTFSNEFDGDGATSRSGSLTAEVTAVVTAVYPNGNLAIKGRREVLINHEKEYISVKGIIRPEDVGPGNTVLSNVIADAKIEYSGLGAISDKQRPGWLMRIVDMIWPF